MRTIMLALAASAVMLSATAVRADERSDLVKYCKPDIERLCKGISPGGGRILKCLKANPNDLTVGCAKALQSLKK